MINSELKHSHHAHKLLRKAGHGREISSLFGVCKTCLVSCIEYERNNQTLISKYELNMRQYDLETRVWLFLSYSMHETNLVLQTSNKLEIPL